jgi:hypothetical protein
LRGSVEEKLACVSCSSNCHLLKVSCPAIKVLSSIFDFLLCFFMFMSTWQRTSWETSLLVRKCFIVLPHISLPPVVCFVFEIK